MDISEYYRNQNVRARMKEFLGGTWPDSTDSLYITQCDASPLELGRDLKAPSELTYFLDNELDISRSLWDRNYLIAHLDIEYVNFDFHAEPYLDASRTFMLQNSSEVATERVLLESGIAPLHMLSGRGHHYVWRINRKSSAFGRLVEIGRLSEHLIKRYAVRHLPVNVPIDYDLGAAFSGLGLVMEYVAMRVKDLAEKGTSIPVDLTAVEVAPQDRGREMISLDITEYGDVLNTRMIRIPYSLYLKPTQRLGALPEEVRSRIPLMVSVPLFEMSTAEGVEVMRDLEMAAELASRASVRIPDQSDQTSALIRAYESSDIAAVHDWFYAEEHEPVELWSRTYDQAPVDLLPYCARQILLNPNELLLKPSGIRHIVRVMLALGWHPRHIAGMIRSKYERDYGWGREWYFYDAAMRADFYTRVFTTMIKTGRDRLTDFDCAPLKELVCEGGAASAEKVQDFKMSLMERVQHERLASRPFNGLFLPDKHL